MTGRALLGACLGLVLAAALLWGASGVVWYRVGTAVVSGGTAEPSLVGIAVLGVAGVAALVATAGPVRRGLGGLLGLAGAWTGVGAALDLVRPPAAVASRAAPVLSTAGPLLAVAGGALLLAVGVFVLVGERRLARIGARYRAGDARAEPADPDRAAWAALDEGRDPTADAGDPAGGRDGEAD